jgi:hypothetical protein
VLGDEHRIGASTLPIDRWMLERLHGGQRRLRRSLPPVAWHGRFAPSPASAEPGLVLPPVIEPPAPNPIGPTAAITPIAEHDALIDDALVDDFELDEPETPATVSALSLDMFVAPASPAVLEPAAPVVREVVTPVREELPEPEAFAPAVLEPVRTTPVTTTPRIVAHDALDPEVRALVDELYEQARAELSGLDVAADVPAPATPTAPPAPRIVDMPLPQPMTVEAPASEAPSASTSKATPQGRSGWVPAFTTEDARKNRSNG